MDYLPLPGTPVEEIDTPAIIVDLDIAEANIAAMAKFAKDNNISMRPHMKTAKSPYWALKQIEAGAIGVCAAKVGEAEILAEGGVREILIPNQVVGATKIRRLMGVASRSNVTVAVDSHENVAELSAAAQAFNTEIGVILEIETGMNRAGVEPGEAAVTLAKAVEAAAGLRFDGIMGYEGGSVFIEGFEARKESALLTIDKLLQAADDIEGAGLPVKIISAGGTGSYDITGKVDRVTELQCGSYLFMDAKYMEVFEGHDHPFQTALTVLGTITSRPVPGRAIADPGMKAIAVDIADPKVVGTPGATVRGMSEEHCVLNVEGEAENLKIGDKIQFLPMHGDTTIAQHAYYYCVRNGVLETIVEITGRGRFM
jgi:D-serine deaminase-like pyridoxal phosphate-dependent protein